MTDKVTPIRSKSDDAQRRSIRHNADFIVKSSIFREFQCENTIRLSGVNDISRETYKQIRQLYDITKVIIVFSYDRTIVRIEC
jgi:hypothetical protein